MNENHVTFAPVKRIKSTICLLLIAVLSFNSIASGSYASIATKAIHAGSSDDKQISAANDLTIPQLNCLAEEQDEVAEDTDLKKIALPASFTTAFNFQISVKKYFAKESSFKLIPVLLFILNSAFII